MFGSLWVSFLKLIGDVFVLSGALVFTVSVSGGICQFTFWLWDGLDDGEKRMKEKRTEEKGREEERIAEKRSEDTRREGNRTSGAKEGGRAVRK